MQNFEKRLKYNKYKNMDNLITIDLHNDYAILALIGKDENGNYDVELRIKESTVEKWDLVEKAEHIIFNANTKNIYSAVLKTVGTYLHEGFFDYYIDRYEYELNCFDIGNEMYEKQLLNKKSYKPLVEKFGRETVYHCSKCDDYVEPEHSYCPRCGAPLDWSDTR